MKSSKWTNKEIENHLVQLLIRNCCEYLDIDSDSIKIEKSESPDYILSDGKNNIGLEISRALDQNLQKAVSKRDKEFKGVTFCPTAFEDRNMSSKEIANILKKSKTGLIGRPYLNDELEEKVACNIIKTILKKIEKFNNYRKFKKNILLVHSEDRVTLNRNFVITKIQEHVSENNVLFDYIVLKLANEFHFFKSDECFSCEIKT